MNVFEKVYTNTFYFDKWDSSFFGKSIKSARNVTVYGDNLFCICKKLSLQAFVKPPAAPDLTQISGITFNLSRNFCLPS